MLNLPLKQMEYTYKMAVFVGREEKITFDKNDIKSDNKK